MFEMFFIPGFFKISEIERVIVIQKHVDDGESLLQFPQNQ